MTNRKIFQDNVFFQHISEGDENELLMQAAEGEITLFAALRSHSAKMIAPEAREIDAEEGIHVRPKVRRRAPALLVPLMSKFANELLLFPEVTISTYPVLTHQNEADSSVFERYVFYLEEPQQISREQVYFEIDKSITREKNVVNQEWQTKLEKMAKDLIESGKKSQATKGHLAAVLSKEISVDSATIARQTKKTWRST